MGKEEHAYKAFIEGVTKSGHEIEYTEDKAELRLRLSGWKVKVTFSYNEPKMYMDFGQPYPFRILDSGYMGHSFMDGLDAQMMALKKLMDMYEG